jgi:ankyrin repeat protein
MLPPPVSFFAGGDECDGKDRYQGSINDIVDPEHLGMTPLMIAADQGDTSKIIKFVKLGEDVNCADEDGWTAMMFAADNGHIDCIRELARLQV